MALGLGAIGAAVMHHGHKKDEVIIYFKMLGGRSKPAFRKKDLKLGPVLQGHMGTNFISMVPVAQLLGFIMRGRISPKIPSQQVWKKTGLCLSLARGST